MKNKLTGKLDIYIVTKEEFEHVIIGLFQRKADALEAAYQDIRELSPEVLVHKQSHPAWPDHSHIMLETDTGVFYHITKETVR